MTRVYQLIPKGDWAIVFNLWSTSEVQAFRLLFSESCGQVSLTAVGMVALWFVTSVQHHGTFGVYEWRGVLLLETRRAEYHIE